MATNVISNATVELDLAGNIEQGIDRVIGGFGRLEQTVSQLGRNVSRGPAQGIQGLGNRFDNFRQQFSTGMHAMGVFAVREMAQMIEHGGRLLQGFGANILTTFGGVAGGILQQGIAFESAQAGFARVFRENAEEALRQTGEVAQRTSFLTSQVRSLAMLIGRSGADPFSQVTASIFDPETNQTVERQISALEALNDLASTRPGSDSMPRLMISLQNFLGGTSARSAVRSLRQVFDLPIEAAREFEAAFESSTDTAGRFQAFVEVAGRRFGGIGQSMANTTGFIIEQFSDIQELLFERIGRQAVDAFKPLLLDIQEFLNELLTAEQEGGDLGEIFTEIAQATVAIVTPMMAIAKAVIRLAAANPMLTKLVIGFTLLVGVVTFLAGTLIVALVSGLTALLVVSIALSVIFFAIPTVLASIAVGFLAIVTALTVGLPFWVAWRANLLGIRTFMERLIPVVRALWQGLSSLTEIGTGQISRETFEQLESLGLTQVVLDLGGAFFRMKKAAEAAWAGISRGLSRAWVRIRPILLRLFGFGGAEVTGQMQTTEAGVSGIIDTINSISPEQWEAFGAAIGEVIERFLTSMETIREIIFWIRATAIFLLIVFSPLIMMFRTFLGVLRLVFSMLERIVSIPLVSSAFSAVTGINLGGTPQMAPSQRKETITPAQSRAAERAQQRSDVDQGQQAFLDRLGSVLGQERFSSAGSANLRKTTVVKVNVDGRQIAEATAEANDNENVRLGVGS